MVIEVVVAVAVVVVVSVVVVKLVVKNRCSRRCGSNVKCEDACKGRHDCQQLVPISVCNHQQWTLQRRAHGVNAL
ncbi:hypothetical protein JZ751_020689 [Albula glossodonta]|uniref:Uncharacterized protein n=1 Tax=Albula glossodonta TaxID=121402 RepID=A0A8T2PKC0_9TELE|nr:hypothetical protein JZ751_020689 [Albula glossodonta]